MRLEITVEGKKYEVEVEVVESERPAPIGGFTGNYQQRAAGAGGAAAAPRAAGPSADPNVDESKVVRCPLAGTVSRVVAEPGQEVKVDETILVLEAMKMETAITSPIDGKVKAIPVAIGDAVAKGQILVEFE
ncbi:MAG: acetyl-CoA carboxylase biotin carboxyl carrier protein subunit [Fimbriimonadaceae bacterium]